MFDLKWSHAEKVIARQAFDLALRNELQTTIREAKDRAAQIIEPAELWELEDWLAERRQDINRNTTIGILFCRSTPRSSRTTGKKREVAAANTLHCVPRMSSGLSRPYNGLYGPCGRNPPSGLSSGQARISYGSEPIPLSASSGTPLGFSKSCSANNSGFKKCWFGTPNIPQDLSSIFGRPIM